MTIRDVAARAGVSAATVSRVFSRPEAVSHETRRRVLTAAEVAAGVVGRLSDRGVPVPGRCSVVGFDDTALASMISPRLTTVRLPVADAGEVAAGLLLDLLRGLPPRPGPVELPVELVVRGSTGVAPDVAP